jgi:hypothetical protein
LCCYQTRSFAVAELPDIGDGAPCQRVLLARLLFLAARSKLTTASDAGIRGWLLKAVNPGKALRRQ